MRPAPLPVSLGVGGVVELAQDKGVAPLHSSGDASGLGHGTVHTLLSGGKDHLHMRADRDSEVISTIMA